MPGGKYKNIVLVALIIGGFLIYMGISTFYIMGDVSKNRSCVRTCDIPLTEKAREELKKSEETK